MTASHPERPMGAVAPAPKVTFRRAINPRTWGTTFTSLSEPEYAWYFAGNVAFFMGMQMQMLLRGYLAFELTDKASSLGIMALAMAFPMLLMAPFGGMTADRVNKRTLLIVTQTVAAMASVLIAFLILTDLIEFWHLLAISLATGSVFSFNMPARQALVPLLVPQHKLMNAISLQMGGMNLTRIIAPAAGGLLIGPLGVGVVYLLTFALFMLAVASEFHLPKHGMKAEKARRESFSEEFMGGFRYIWQHPTLRLLIVAALVMPLFGFPVQQMLPVFAKDVFTTPGDDGFRLGMLAAATGVGGLTGAVISANLDNQQQKGRLMLLGGLLMGSFILLFAWSPLFYVALLFLGAMGIGQMLFQATNNTTIQAGLPPEVRGRVMSIMMMSFGLMPLGVLPVTIAADHIGAPASIAISAAMLLAALLLLFAASPRLRNLRLAPMGRSELSPVQAAAMVAEGKITQEEADRLTGEAARRAGSSAAG